MPGQFNMFGSRKIINSRLLLCLLFPVVDEDKDAGMINFYRHSKFGNEDWKNMTIGYTQYMSQTLCSVKNVLVEK